MIGKLLPKFMKSRRGIMGLSTMGLAILGMVAGYFVEPLREKLESAPVVGEIIKKLFDAIDGVMGKKEEPIDGSQN